MTSPINPRVLAELARDLRGATAESHLRHAQVYREIKRRFGSAVAVQVADLAR